MLPRAERESVRHRPPPDRPTSVPARAMLLRLALGAVLVVLVGIGSLYAYRAQSPDSPPFVGVVLALLPLFALIALILVAAWAFSRSVSRSSGPRRVEALAKLADLRDRGALTEDEFQREKQRLLT